MWSLNGRTPCLPLLVWEVKTKGVISTQELLESETNCGLARVQRKSVVSSGPRLFVPRRVHSPRAKRGRSSSGTVVTDLTFLLSWPHSFPCRPRPLPPKGTWSPWLLLVTVSREDRPEVGAFGSCPSTPVKSRGKITRRGFDFSLEQDGNRYGRYLWSDVRGTPILNVVEVNGDSRGARLDTDGVLSESHLSIVYASVAQRSLYFIDDQNCRIGSCYENGSLILVYVTYQW